MSAGDALFTFVAVGYVWTVYDTRDAQEVGELYRDIAVIFPTDAEGNRLEEITVHGATRSRVSLRARWAGQTVQVYQTNSGNLTEKTAAEVCSAAEYQLVAIHPVAELAQDEIADRATATLVARARHAAYQAHRESAYDSAITLDGVTKAQRAMAVKAATEAFERELADRMRVTL